MQGLLDRFVLIIVVSIGSLPVCSDGKTTAEILYLNEKCGQEVTVTSDVGIHWTQTSGPLQSDTECNMVLRLNSSDPDNYLVGDFNSYLVTFFDHDYNVENCTFVSLQMTTNETKHFGQHGHCQDYTPKAIRGGLNLGGVYDKIQFGYKTGQKSSLVVPGNFTLVVTSVFYKDKSQSECPSGYFNCQTKNKCVKKSVICNGLNDCGNSKDEWEDCVESKTHLDLVSIIAVPVASVVGGVLVVLIYSFWKKKRSNSNEQLGASH